MPSRMLDLDLAVREAMAVYYFPGMWDWNRGIVLPLVLSAFERSLQAQRARSAAAQPPSADQEAAFADAVRAGKGLLERYFDWASAVDRFSPVRVETDVEVNIPDPANPEVGLTTPGGDPVRYAAKVHLLAVDEHDRYWVVHHRVADAWWGTDQLALDEEPLSLCWAWEECYLGMEVAGTIHNEFSFSGNGSGPPPGAGTSPPGTGTSPPGTERAPPGTRRHQRGGIPQHEASGGGRSIPQHRRMYVKTRGPEPTARIEQREASGFRRTRIRRTRQEVRALWLRVAAEAREMVDPGLEAYPNPRPEHCARCDYVAPCLAMDRGEDAEGLLAARYRSRGPDVLVEGRLGGTSWGMGRGAAPPKFGGAAAGAS